MKSLVNYFPLNSISIIQPLTSILEPKLKQILNGFTLKGILACLWDGGVSIYVSGYIKTLFAEMATSKSTKRYRSKC